DIPDGFLIQVFNCAVPSLSAPSHDRPGELTPEPGATRVPATSVQPGALLLGSGLAGELRRHRRVLVVLGDRHHFTVDDVAPGEAGAAGVREAPFPGLGGS